MYGDGQIFSKLPYEKRDLHDFLLLCQELGRHRRVREEDPICERNDQSHATRQQEEDPPGLERGFQADLQDTVREKTGDDLCALENSA